jgi:hypothetical protein
MFPKGSQVKLSEKGIAAAMSGRLRIPSEAIPGQLAGEVIESFFKQTRLVEVKWVNQNDVELVGYDFLEAILPPVIKVSDDDYWDDWMGV